jgi:hypothetical protein
MKTAETGFQRREFIKNSAAAAGVVVLCGCAKGHPRGAERAGAGAGEDEGAQRRRMLEGLAGVRKHAEGILVSSYGEEFAASVAAETDRELERLIPEIPYIGGDENRLTENLNQAALALALHRAMTAHGKGVEETGSVLYRTVESMVGSYPRFVTRAIGFLGLTPFEPGKVREAALESQERRYPGDWVLYFVEGDGEDFDWGMDYTECGIVKFLRAQGADDLAPYLCLADFPVSDAFGLGLERTTTIAEGAERCDFRFKRGRETPRGWPPKLLDGEKRREPREHGHSERSSHREGA